MRRMDDLDLLKTDHTRVQLQPNDKQHEIELCHIKTIKEEHHASQAIVEIPRIGLRW